jgi:hypothetical protein
MGPIFPLEQGTGQAFGTSRRLSCPLRLGGSVVSKKTKKRKLRARRNKANHGKRPNVGRR